MKVQSNYRKDSSDDNKNERRADWVANARRQAVKNEESAAAKHRQIETPVTEETKFSGILESAIAPQKIKRTGGADDEPANDEKKDDKNNSAPDKDSADNAAVENRVERNASQFGGNFGGSGFGGGGVNQTVRLSENFAARSILHIADLERMISAVRKLNRLDGRREITLELKRSVLEGLKVKITAGDASQIQIEFVAQNEKVRAQIENHSEELANILRGRGVNLQSLRTILDDGKTDEKLTAFESKTGNAAAEKFSGEQNSAGTRENTFDE